MGKTTIARKLAVDLSFTLVAKDSFKELFYDTLGTPSTRDESRVYGLAATKALYASAGAFLGAGRNVILESVFAKGLAEIDINALTNGSGARLVQVHVTASPKIRLERYDARIVNGDRHPGHPDSEGAMTEEYFANDSDRYGSLDIDDTIGVNTDSFSDTDYDNLLQSIKKIIGE